MLIFVQSSSSNLFSSTLVMYLTNITSQAPTSYILLHIYYYILHHVGQFFETFLVPVLWRSCCFQPLRWDFKSLNPIKTRSLRLLKPKLSSSLDSRLSLNCSLWRTDQVGYASILVIWPQLRAPLSILAAELSLQPVLLALLCPERLGALC